ncbi:MAG: disulfide bond formation protein B [Pseudomonadota bacterium]
MTPKHLAIVAALGSAALLAGAFAFQALGYAPCQMCLWQRWPHAVAIGAGALALTGVSLTLVAILGAASALTTAAIGLYHTGVERKILAGPQACSGGGGSLTDLSIEELLSTDGTVNVVRCDEVAWAFAGLSMASWNAVFSLAFASLWAVAALRTRRRV